MSSFSRVGGAVDSSAALYISSTEAAAAGQPSLTRLPISGAGCATHPLIAATEANSARRTGHTSYQPAGDR